MDKGSLLTRLSVKISSLNNPRFVICKIVKKTRVIDHRNVAWKKSVADIFLKICKNRLQKNSKIRKIDYCIPLHIPISYHFRYLINGVDSLIASRYNFNGPFIVRVWLIGIFSANQRCHYDWLLNSFLQIGDSSSKSFNNSTIYIFHREFIDILSKIRF